MPNYNLPDGCSDDDVDRANGVCPDCESDMDECSCEEDELSYGDYLYEIQREERMEKELGL